MVALTWERFLRKDQIHALSISERVASMKSTSAKKNALTPRKARSLLPKISGFVGYQIIDIGSDHRCHLHHVDGFAFLEIS